MLIKELVFYDSVLAGIDEQEDTGDKYFFILVDEADTDQFWLYIPVEQNGNKFKLNREKDWLHKYNVRGEEKTVNLVSKQSKNFFLKYYDVDLRVFQDHIIL